MSIEQELSQRLSHKGFHGFTRHVKTGMAAFFGPDGYKDEYDIVPGKNGKLHLALNVVPIGDFDNADDIADYLLTK